MGKLNKAEQQNNKKVVFDQRVQRLLFLKQEMASFDAEAKELLATLEGQYNFSAEEKEIIEGIEYIMEKVPVNQGKNSYDDTKLMPFLKALGDEIYNKVVKEKVIRKSDIDVKELEKLVKDGKLPAEVLNNCRKNKWTFRSLFKKIEKNNDKKAV